MRVEYARPATAPAGPSGPVLERRVLVATPEGVDLPLVLAGLGSRAIAAAVDLAIRLVVLFALVVALLGPAAARGGDLLGWAVAILALATFVLLFGYDVVFEVLAGGRTPGKRAAGLRVVMADGTPVTFLPSAVRTMLRLVDLLPAVYAIGIVAILASPRNRRLGDVAAGTLVVRERREVDRLAAKRIAWPSPWAAAPPAWDVSAVTAEDAALVRGLLERRGDLTPAARAALAVELADRLWPKVAGAPPGLHPEVFLDGVVAAKATRG